METWTSERANKFHHFTQPFEDRISKCEKETLGAARLEKVRYREIHANAAKHVPAEVKPHSSIVEGAQLQRLRIVSYKMAVDVG